MRKTRNKRRGYLYQGVLLLVLGIFAAGCAGTHYNTKTVNGHRTVTRVDEDGSKTVVYEVTREGNTVVRDEKDPMAQQYLAEKKREELAVVEEEARQERIRNARKRYPSDPIYVAVLPIELGPDLASAQHSDDAVYQQILQEFKDDPVIRLVTREDIRRSEWTRIGKALTGTDPKVAPAADVTVRSTGDLKEVVGISRKTGKPAKGVQIILEAQISSNFLSAEYSVQETGNVFDNVEMTRRFAAQIKRIIKTRIGPDIPVDRSL